MDINLTTYVFFSWYFSNVIVVVDVNLVMSCWALKIKATKNSCDVHVSTLRQIKEIISDQWNIWYKINKIKHVLHLEKPRSLLKILFGCKTSAVFYREMSPRTSGLLVAGSFHTRRSSVLRVDKKLSKHFVCYKFWCIPLTSSARQQRKMTKWKFYTEREHTTIDSFFLPFTSWTNWNTRKEVQPSAKIVWEYDSRSSLKSLTFNIQLNTLTKKMFRQKFP